MKAAKHFATLLALFAPMAAWAQAGGLPMLTSTAGADGVQTYSLSIQTLLTLTALTFLPAALLMMTSFTRIIIVLSLLRHALGTQTSPPNQVLVGLALFLTFFVMSPVLDDLGNEINLSFDFFENQFEGEVQEVFLSGGSVLLPFLEESFEKIFEKRTKTWNPVEGLKVRSDNVDVEALNQLAPQLAVAIGLAAAS